MLVRSEEEKVDKYGAYKWGLGNPLGGGDGGNNVRRYRQEEAEGRRGGEGMADRWMGRSEGGGAGGARAGGHAGGAGGGGVLEGGACVRRGAGPVTCGWAVCAASLLKLFLFKMGIFFS